MTTTDHIQTAPPITDRRRSSNAVTRFFRSWFAGYVAQYEIFSPGYGFVDTSARLRIVPVA